MRGVTSVHHIVLMITFLTCDPTLDLSCIDVNTGLLLSEVLLGISVLCISEPLCIMSVIRREEISGVTSWDTSQTQLQMRIVEQLSIAACHFMPPLPSSSHKEQKNSL